jgi:hypothetical protein
MRRSPGSIREAARRFSIPLAKRAAPSCAVGKRLYVIGVPEDAVAGLEAAALARGIEPHALIAELATVAGREGAGFIGNVLDDGGQG